MLTAGQGGPARAAGVPRAGRTGLARRLLPLTALLLLGLRLASAELPPNLISGATLSASSMASPSDGKYGVMRLADGDRGTHWASADHASLPQWVRAEWPQAVEFDTIVIDAFWRQAATIYAPWQTARLSFSDGAAVESEFRDDEELVVVRLEQPRTVTWAELRIVSVHVPKTYVGLSELGFYLDPRRQLQPPRRVATAKPVAELRVEARPTHPTVYAAVADVERARRRAEDTAWGKAEKSQILAEAAPWLAQDEAYWLQFLPAPGACYAYGFTGCPICSGSCGTWAGARCRWDQPGKVTCTSGHCLPDAAHPDAGSGYTAPDGRIHYLTGTWNAWVTEQWTLRAVPALAHAYALTGELVYAERAAFFLDALASIYAESTAGSWDYPSRPPSGRLARPWYQVARNLVVYVEAYDLVHSSPALDRPSLRPRLEASFAPPPTRQQTAVGTADARGRSWAGMTRRQNLDTNLMRDAADYCYVHTFAGHLHNGHADYMRGALAVGALLGIPEYVYNAVESPYSIYAMLANNCDRDGRYYETALGYALHARELYLSFLEPLRNWRCSRYPQGVDLCADARLRSFYYLPELVMQTAGHSPNFGDAGPDNAFRFQAVEPFSATDYGYAERLYAGCQGAEKAEFGQVLQYLARGDVDKARAGSGLKRWLLYHAEPVPATTPATLPADLERRIFESWLLGQKGIGLLRSGRGPDAQAALLRYGPSLNHGDLDDLGLIYYAKGWQLTYEIGYGLASTHTQVGWGSQTVSHAIVTVNESSQRGGSGGSACLFASLPSVKIMAADSPLSYSTQGVTQYQRTVALVGIAPNQYLVDIFRVKGGRQHDYGVGVQTQELTTQGLDFGPEEEGSLAGPDQAWGEMLGNDGDVRGHPNQPYWNPPPGNGYGFFYDARRVPASVPFSVDFALGGRNQARLRVHALPEPDSTAILAKAPGLYPSNRKATYLLLRRQAPPGQALASAFAAVMAPYAAAGQAPGLNGQALLAAVVENQGEFKYLPDLDAVLLKGTKGGDFVTFAVNAETEAAYEVSAYFIKAPSYGNVCLQVDDTRLGEPFPATADSVQGPVRVAFGHCRLTQGVHRLRVELLPGSSAWFIGVAALDLTPWDPQQAPIASELSPVLALAERVPVLGEPADSAPVGVHLRRPDGSDEYVFSTPLLDLAWRATTSAGEIAWRGAFVFLRCRNGAVVTMAGHGAWAVTVGTRPYGPRTGGVWSGRVVGLNEAERWVEADVPLPPDVAAACAYFSNPRYSRNTAYRLYGVRAVVGGARLDLGPQPVLLGQGRVHQITAADEILSDIPHDYACSVIGGNNTRFFDGKRLANGRGAETHLRQVTFGTPMALSVDSTDGFAEGEPLYYYDLQIGDSVTIPTAWEVCP